MENRFDLAMTFLRWIEYQENIDERFHKPFTIVEFMEKYSKEHGDNFTYATDWAGYNVPSRIFKKYKFESIPDFNNYDKHLQEIVTSIYALTGGEEFSLIGHAEGQDSVLEHELCHAFYDRIPEYREEVDAITDDLKEKHREALMGALLKMGYNSNVHMDELQAYLSTGLSPELFSAFQIKRIPKKTTKRYEEVFKKYKREIKW
jgi:hypothetical protein